MPQRFLLQLLDVMTTINLNLPDDLKAQVERRATEAGYASIGAYIEDLLRADSHDIDYGAPPHLTVTSSADLESKLLEGLNSPTREMTDADWEEKRRRLIERHSRRSGG
jgi:hypothetical protein